MDAGERLARAMAAVRGEAWARMDKWEQDAWTYVTGKALELLRLDEEPMVLAPRRVMEIEELDRLRKRVADLEAGLQWALNEGGWRLWYDARTPPPPVIEVPKRVGETARVRPMEEAG